jgi:DNA topoisomerase-3
MMKVVDEIGQNHFICQRLSCSYEEKEIKKRVPIEVADEPKAVVKVVAKPKESAAATPKKRVVVKKALPKKSAMKLPDDHSKAPKKGTYTWETVIEVVRPSKLTYRRDDRRPDVAKKREDRPWGNNNAPSAVVSETPTAGGTFADFMKASEERKKRDRNKKR